MSTDTSTNPISTESRLQILKRAEMLYSEQLRNIRSRTDRVFAALIALEWVGSVVIAIWVSPRAWAESSHQVFPPFAAAILFGGLITAVPLFLVMRRPGASSTRHAVAVSQMLFSALLIHLTAGRIETHFHVFGSLAFLAWYLDWRVLGTATVVVVADHVLRGVYWPQSVFGTDTPSFWRAFEHGAWVLFEDAFLVIWSQFGLHTLWESALQQARLKQTNQLIESKVRIRTRELQEFANEKEEAQHKLEVQARVLETQAAQLTVAKQDAEQANRAKSQFLANMSHELRTPMTAILGFADILEGSVERPDQRDAVNTIKRNGAYLLELVNDILDLSKIEAGKIQVEHIRCSTLSILADVASLMRVRAAAKGLPLDLEYVGPIPETIETDPTRLRQILINLIGNAIKFTEVGRIRLIVQMYTPPSGDPRLRINVADTGLGMTEAQVERLFRPFTQADNSTTRRFGGTGLGLSISKRFAEMLDGDIHVHSTPGKGSTFIVEVSIGSLAGVRLLTGPFEASMSRTHGDGSNDVRLGGHVLLAEDGPDNQRLISFVLRRAGAEVTIADNGQTAVELALAADAEGHPFNCVLMDMQMPIMDGYAATQKLRAAGYRHPIVALTAHAMASDQGKCITAGCDAYTTKPLQRQQLLTLLAQYCPASETATAR